MHLPGHHFWFRRRSNLVGADVQRRGGAWKVDLESRTGAGRNRSPVVSDPVKWSCLEEELEGARVLSLCSVVSALASLLSRLCSRVSALASSLPGPLSLLSSTVFVYERPASSGHVKRGLECQTKRSRQQALLSVYVHDNSDGLVLRCYVVTLLRCTVPICIYMLPATGRFGEVPSVRLLT